MLNFAVLASTQGTDLQAIIDEIKSGELKNAHLSCVISNKENCYALERTKNEGFEGIFIDHKGKERESFDKEIDAILTEKNVELVVLVGYMLLFSSWFTNKYKNKIINVHPSLLPSFPGMDLDVHQEVLNYGCKVSGCTFHFVDEGMDTGPIILQKTIEIENNETSESLKTKVQSLEMKWYPELIRLYADKKIQINERKVIVL